MIPAKIIVIDDNEAVLTSLRLILKNEFSTVIAVADPRLIPALIREEDVDVVLLDMNFGKGKLDGKDGLFWLDRIKHRSDLVCPPSVVLITAFGDVELAVESLKQGADDFVQKPWDNDRLIQALKAAIEKHRHPHPAASDTPASPVNPVAPAAPTLDELERQHIEQVLATCNHNIGVAAATLGISRQTLYNKMKRHGID